MKIVQVSAEPHYRYIPLKGWESVGAAVNAYARGFAKGSRATEKVTAQAIGASQGDLAEVFFVVSSAMLHDSDAFVKKMLTEAKSALESRDRWSKHYDYDAMGTSFFKTSVDIKWLDRSLDLYLLGIWAAYVGDQPEAGLAEHLGIPRSLTWCDVTVQTEPLAGDRFAFDFEQVVRRLDPVLGTDKISGAEIAQAMLLIDEYGESNPKFILSQNDDVCVTIIPSGVKRRFDWEDPFGPKRRRLDTWKVEGSVLIGLLKESFRDKNTKEPPSFSISLSGSQDLHQGGTIRPIWQPERKERILALADQIIVAM